MGWVGLSVFKHIKPMGFIIEAGRGKANMGVWGGGGGGGEMEGEGELKANAGKG